MPFIPFIVKPLRFIFSLGKKKKLRKFRSSEYGDGLVSL